MSAVVTFEGVTKRFTIDRERPRSFREAFVAMARRRAVATETLVALDDVSFQLDQGGTLGLVGPNGTGKSTVLKLAARILEPTAGRIAVTGRVAALLELGAGFHPDLSGRENILLNGALMGLDRRDVLRRIDRIVAFAELERFIHMPVKHYSSGMYMRLGFATAVHMDAETLLVDEVLAVGDQAFQGKCRDRIAQLRKSGVTILLVSHDPGQVRDLCAEALWLEGGKVLARGRSDEVLEAYFASVREREEARYAAEEASEGPPAPAETDRWGTGEVEIVAVDCLGPDGALHHTVLTGDDVTVRIHYVAHHVVPDPVFGLALHRDDGVHLNGANTLLAGFDIAAVDGPGVVTFHIRSLPLLAGSYEISASCHDRANSRFYDYHHRRFALRVRTADAYEQVGMMRLDATWDHRPGEA
jgi:ABC-type polysaccharide/polyol phosphate transport system ATPase subunit